MACVKSLRRGKGIKKYSFGAMAQILIIGNRVTPKESKTENSL